MATTFRLRVTNEQIDVLRARLLSTRWPSYDLRDDWSLGTSSDDAKRLACYSTQASGRPKSARSSPRAAGATARNQGLAQPLHDSAMDLALEVDRVHHRPDVNLPRGTGSSNPVPSSSESSANPPLLPVPGSQCREADGAAAGAPVDPPSPRSRWDADHPENGVLIPCRFTADLARRGSRRKRRPRG